MVGDEIVARPPSGIVGRIEHIRRHLPLSERKTHATVALCIAGLSKVGSNFSTQERFLGLPILQHQVDDRPSYTVLGRRAIHHFRLLHVAHRRSLQQIGQLFARHGRRASVQHYRHASCSNQAKAPALLPYSRQAGQGFVSVACCRLFGQGFHVVGQGTVLCLHQGTFSTDHHFAQGIGILFVHRHHPHITCRIIVLHHTLVEQMLKNQAIPFQRPMEHKASQ